MHPTTEILIWRADEESAGTRLDVFVQERLGTLSRSQVKALILEGAVTANDKVRAPGHRLRPGEEVRLPAPPPPAPPPAVRGEKIPLDVAYEDEHLLIVNKPAGLVVHPAPGNADGTLANALVGRYGDGIRDLGGENRCGLIHRLDKETTGLLVVARTEAAHERLKADMAARRIQRRYLGLTLVEIRETEGVIDRPIGRVPNNRKRMGVCREGEGRAARTGWRVLAGADSVSLLLLRLHTGRTHQIRVHMSSIGRPILGDPVYGFSRQRSLLTLPPKLRGRFGPHLPERQMLHAAGLALTHPVTGEPVLVTAPPPEDMLACIERTLGTLPFDPLDAVREDLARIDETDEATGDPEVADAAGESGGEADGDITDDDATDGEE